MKLEKIFLTQPSRTVASAANRGKAGRNLIEPLYLDPADEIARGGARRIFRHPTHPELLIKTLLERSREKAMKWPRSLRPSPQFMSFERETTGFLVAFSESGSPCPFIAPVVGFVETNHGLGMVVRAVTSDDGNLGRTLQQIAEEDGIAPTVERAIERFLEWAAGTRVVIHDLSPRNLVMGSRELTLVDGFGDRTLIPVRTYSSLLNARGNAQRIAMLRRWLAHKQPSRSV
jgi:hypothetical protein